MTKLVLNRGAHLTTKVITCMDALCALIHDISPPMAHIEGLRGAGKGTVAKTLEARVPRARYYSTFGDRKTLTPYHEAGLDISQATLFIADLAAQWTVRYSHADMTIINDRCTVSSWVFARICPNDHVKTLAQPEVDEALDKRLDAFFQILEQQSSL